MKAPNIITRELQLTVGQTDKRISLMERESAEVSSSSDISLWGECRILERIRLRLRCPLRGSGRGGSEHGVGRACEYGRLLNGDCIDSTELGRQPTSFESESSRRSDSHCEIRCQPRESRLRRNSFDQKSPLSTSVIACP